MSREHPPTNVPAPGYATQIKSKPAWRGSFRKKRAILPMAGFYEWMPVERADGTVRKQPYYIHPIENDRVLSVAGLYELWRDPEAAEDDPNRWLWTATVITCDATGAAGEIHDRTPMMLPGDRVDAWLDPGLTDKNQVRQLLTGIEVPPLEARAVSPAVNRVGTNRPELLEPIDTGADQQLQLALVV
jgi:putative SOS response-associated peptidase YedK